MSALAHKFVLSNGIQMHYVEQGDGPLVVLCHGWPESWYSWRHQIPALASAGYRVVVPDQRGYGETEAPDSVEAYDMFNLVGDLVGLVKAVGESRAILIGHDWGSMVAASAALLRPDIFRGLGLLSVPYLPRRKSRPGAVFEAITREKNFYQEYFQAQGRIENELEQDVRKSLLGILYTASGAAVGKQFAVFDKNTRFVDNLSLPDRVPDWLSEEDLDVFVRQFERSGFRGGINWYRNMDRNWSLTSFLVGAKIMQPTVFLAGALDGVLKGASEEFEALERNVPNLIKKQLIPDAGHWVQQERPRETTELLLEFVRKIYPD